MGEDQLAAVVRHDEGEGLGVGHRGPHEALGAVEALDVEAGAVGAVVEPELGVDVGQLHDLARGSGQTGTELQMPRDRGERAVGDPDVLALEGVDRRDLGAVQGHGAHGEQPVGELELALPGAGGAVEGRRGRQRVRADRVTAGLEVAAEQRAAREGRQGGEEEQAGPQVTHGLLLPRRSGVTPPSGARPS